MPLLDEPPVSAVSVAPSFAVELMWALEAAVEPRHRAMSPIYSAIYQDEALLRRAAAFYNDTVGCFPDVVALACLGGVLRESDVAVTVAGIGHAIEHTTGTLRLATEREEDRRSIHSRLASLHDDPKRRRTYLTLVGNVATALEPAWLADGHALAAAERLAGDEERGISWRRLLERECPKFGPWIENLGARFEPESVLLVPSAFAHPGSGLLLDLPGVLVAGVSVRRTDPRDDRAHAELARRLKSLADPTRLALFVRLAEGSSTVGDLAREFSLSQPTVSNHVKLLREVGLLVEVQHNGRRRGLAVDRAALDGLLGDLSAVIASRESA